MIPAMGRIQTNLCYDAELLGLLLLRSGFLGLPASVGTLLLRLVMGMRFLVVVAALATEKEQNLLRVAGTHTDSFRRWRVAVKRTTLSPADTSGECEPGDTFGGCRFSGRSSLSRRRVRDGM
jgi:hypothetical protein